MNRSPADTEISGTTAEQVVAVAMESFARHGFEDTRLEAIAQESGMSKRMIHYHFGDKRNLYVQALLRAVTLIRPDASEMELPSTVPVDGIRKIVQVICRRMFAEPAAVRLILLENLFKHAEVTGASPLADQSAVLLALDRLLMLGQDSGAFRPGISALDIYTVISSLCAFRTSNRDTYLNLYDVDLADDTNTAGLERLAVDAVLSFLTSNMPGTGTMSYLAVGGREYSDDHDSGNVNIYGETDSS
ncbi:MULTISPECIES: TetR/AcrR family transcriptional regulator [unclassified Corynebacterium]|uniref:TetR/AcrR family transcriptional regulator n=1 Tax=unclassified Corynebacterium TaxID=2624378 RepID=UPI003524A418